MEIQYRQKQTLLAMTTFIVQHSLNSLKKLQ